MAGKSLFDQALQAEGITGPLAALARGIYGQESDGGHNASTSNRGAVGGMQIIPSTFKSMADPGWDINDPLLNARAGIRYLKQLDKQAGGDPRLTAAGYYGGPGALEKARQGIAVSDPKNPNAPNTLQYADQVAARVGKQGPVGAQKQVAAQPLPPTPTAVGDAGAAPDQPEAVAEAPAAAAAPSQLTMPAVDPWQEFRSKVAAARAPVQPQDLAYDQPQAFMPAPLQMPAFNTAPIPLQRTDFRPFAALKRWTS